MRMLGDIPKLVDSHLTDRNVLSNNVQTEVELVLPLHPEPSPYGTHAEYLSDNTVKELTRQPDQTTVASPPKAYSTAIKRASRIAKVSVVKEKTVHLPIDLRGGADLRYTGNKRSDTKKSAKRGVAKR